MKHYVDTMQHSKHFMKIEYTNYMYIYLSFRAACISQCCDDVGPVSMSMFVVVVINRTLQRSVPEHILEIDVNVWML